MNAQEILKRNLPLSEFGHPIWSESDVIKAMEEYAQQSQSNPSKLVEALKNIAKECTSNEVSISFIEHEAKEALSEYATEEVTRVNPYKDLKCKYVYDYCNPETCTCSKSWRWEVENNKAQQSLESYNDKFVYFIEDTNPNREGLWLGLEPTALSSWSNGVKAWTNDPLKAYPFKTFKEADEIRKKLNIDGYIVTEHEFVPKQALESYKDGWVSECEILFGNHLMCRLSICNNTPTVIAAVNGWGNNVPNEEICIKLPEPPPTHPQADSHDRTNP